MNPAEHERHQVAAKDKLLTRLAQLLAQYPTVVLSGERIAAELGVTRSTVWRGVEELRALGVRIPGHPSEGYQLAELPDLLLPALIIPRLRTINFGRKLHHSFRIRSTQDAAQAAAAAGEPEGAVFIAEEQTAGRGRSDHRWVSAPSQGITMSLLLRPPGPPARVLPLNLAAALAVADSVEQATAVTPDLRWPNDLLLCEKKFCGLLLEMTAEATRIQHVILGIGLNVNQAEMPPELAGEATSLRLETGTVVSRLQLVTELLAQLERRYRQFRDGDIRALLDEFERRSSYARGREVSVGEGDEAYTGVSDGLDDFGFLRVRSGSQLRTVISGRVRPLDTTTAETGR
jgi:BirA family biotin operon repressor/biotin-[acetyl-CoA-carboxylase] ligase